MDVMGYFCVLRGYGDTDGESFRCGLLVEISIFKGSLNSSKVREWRPQPDYNPHQMLIADIGSAGCV